MKTIRQLDKLVDELAKGKPLEKVRDRDHSVLTGQWRPAARPSGRSHLQRYRESVSRAVFTASPTMNHGSSFRPGPGPTCSTLSSQHPRIIGRYLRTNPFGCSTPRIEPGDTVPLHTHRWPAVLHAQLERLGAPQTNGVKSSWIHANRRCRRSLLCGHSVLPPAHAGECRRRSHPRNQHRAQTRDRCRQPESRVITKSLWP